MTGSFEVFGFVLFIIIEVYLELLLPLFHHQKSKDMFITSDLKLKEGWVYILSNKHRNVLYIGVTNDLIKRINEHRSGTAKQSFTVRYNCFDLLYYEHFGRIDEAIIREKQLKTWRKSWKMDLIKTKNENLRDLYNEFLEGKYLWE